MGSITNPIDNTVQTLLYIHYCTDTIAYRYTIGTIYCINTTVHTLKYIYYCTDTTVQTLLYRYYLTDITVHTRLIDTTVQTRVYKHHCTYTSHKHYCTDTSEQTPLYRHHCTYTTHRHYCTDTSVQTPLYTTVQTLWHRHCFTDTIRLSTGCEAHKKLIKVSILTVAAAQCRPQLTCSSSLQGSYAKAVVRNEKVCTSFSSYHQIGTLSLRDVQKAVHPLPTCDSGFLEYTSERKH